MTDNTEEVEAAPVSRMSEEELWKTAQHYHEMMCDEIEAPGDVIGACAVMFTNMLIGGVLSGLDPKLVAVMLHMIGEDVQSGVEQLSPKDNTVQ